MGLSTSPLQRGEKVPLCNGIGKTIQKNGDAKQTKHRKLKALVMEKKVCVCVLVIVYF